MPVGMRNLKPVTSWTTLTATCLMWLVASGVGAPAANTNALVTKAHVSGRPC